MTCCETDCSTDSRDSDGVVGRGWSGVPELSGAVVSPAFHRGVLHQPTCVPAADADGSHSRELDGRVGLCAAREDADGSGPIGGGAVAEMPKIVPPPTAHRALDEQCTPVVAAGRDRLDSRQTGNVTGNRRRTGSLAVADASIGLETPTADRADVSHDAGVCASDSHRRRGEQIGAVHGHFAAVGGRHLGDSDGEADENEKSPEGGCAAADHGRTLSIVII